MFTLARLLLAALFLAGAVQKWLDPLPAMQLLALMHLPSGLIWPAAVFNLVGAFALIGRVRLRLWAPLLALYCVFTSLFHLMLLPDPWQATIVVKNWAIAGGLLAVAEVERLRRTTASTP